MAVLLVRDGVNLIVSGTGLNQQGKRLQRLGRSGSQRMLNRKQQLLISVNSCLWRDWLRRWRRGRDQKYGTENERGSRGYQPKTSRFPHIAALDARVYPDLLASPEFFRTFGSSHRIPTPCSG